MSLSESISASIVVRLWESTPMYGTSFLKQAPQGQCVNELYEGRLSDRFVKECLSRIEIFQSMGVNVLMVFDGGRLPSKAGE